MRSCSNCQKSYKMGGVRKLLRGHYNPTNWKKKKANIQWAHNPKTNKRALMCTKCIKTLTRRAVV